MCSALSFCVRVRDFPQRRAATKVDLQNIGSGIVRERATLICKRNGQFLFVRRAEGRWALPGGKIKQGEPPADAAARELREETGLVAQAVTYLFQFGGKDNLHHVFEATVLDSDRPHPQNEISDCEWYPSEETDRLATSVATRGILECLRS
ncbi:NUDIX hydrolase [Paraburkholderia rhynchosiae]